MKITNLLRSCVDPSRQKSVRPEERALQASRRMDGSVMVRDALTGSSPRTDPISTDPGVVWKLRRPGTANGARGSKCSKFHITDLVKGFENSVRPARPSQPIFLSKDNLQKLLWRSRQERALRASRRARPSQPRCYTENFTNPFVLRSELCERLEGWTVVGLMLFIALLMPTCLMPWYFNYKPNMLLQSQAIEAQQAPLVTIMLVPAGDAHNQGRALEHQFESSSSIACALSLKASIEKTYPEIRVIVSHKAGEIVQQYQIPNMANTLGVDLVFTINCYHEQGPKPELYIYQFSYGADFINKLTDLSWYTIESDYLFSKNCTHAWATALAQGLNSDAYNALFTVHGPYKMPFRPLVGIKVPAMGLEMSLKQDDDWSSMVNPLVASLEPIVRPLIKQRTLVEVA